jgi:hypothetical protein
VTTTAVARRGRFFPDGFYSMHSDKELMDIAESTSLPTAMRLFMLASARSNYWGHAPFSNQEICQTLGISGPTRRAAIRSLISGKVIAPTSTHLCIVLSAAVVRRADKAYRTCIEPIHVDCQRRMWVAGIGWETSEGEWQATVSNPATAALVATRTTRKRRVVEEVETVESILAPEWRDWMPTAPWAAGQETDDAWAKGSYA